MCYAPHHRASRRASPRGEALEQGFTFFRIFATSKNEKGEALTKERLTIFAEFCVEQNEARGILDERRAFDFMRQGTRRISKERFGGLNLKL